MFVNLQVLFVEKNVIQIQFYKHFEIPYSYNFFLFLEVFFLRKFLIFRISVLVNMDTGLNRCVERNQFVGT